jgi:hypothetical protein
MKTYSTHGRKSVQSESIKAAAEIFAARIARNEFGKRGDCRTCKMDSYSQDGTSADFSAFIGITRGNETTGRNINFSVLAA